MLLKAYLDYLRYERAASERTISEYQADLKAFESFYKGLDSDLSWETIDTDIAREWVVDMMEECPRSFCTFSISPPVAFSMVSA